LLASGRINRVLPTVSSSTTFVILTLPTFQNIRRFSRSWADRAFGFFAERCWFPPLRAMDHLTGPRVEGALASEERVDARIVHFG
jgi:hypothetical protein